MADNLTTISVDHLNKAVNKAVELSGLPKLTGMSKDPPSVNIKLAGKEAEPSKSSSKVKEHVFVRPSSSSVRRRRIDGPVSKRSSHSVVTTTTSPSKTPGTNSVAVVKTGTAQLNKAPVSSLPIVLPTSSAQPILVATSTQIKPSAPVVTSKTKTKGLIQAAGGGLQSPVLQTLPLTHVPVSNNGGVAFQLQVPVVQPLIQGAPVVYSPNSLLSVGANSVKLVSATINQTSRVVLQQLPSAITKPQTSAQTCQVILPKATVSIPMSNAPTSVSYTNRQQTLPHSVEVPDILAAATQAAIPHLVAKYTADKPIPAVALQEAPDKNESQLQCIPHIPRMVPSSVQSPALLKSMSRGICIVPSDSNVQLGTLSRAIAQENDANRTQHKATAVNEDGTNTTQGQLENIIAGFDTYLPVDEDKSADKADNFSGLFCVDCNRVNVGKCSIHKVSHIRRISDSPIPSRARLSLPSCLHINSNGVEAIEKIKKYTRCGPLVGVVMKKGAVQAQTPYLWKVCSSEGEWLNCSDEDKSNWMRFVRPASIKQEQNMVAYMEGENIYFTATDDIEPNTELRYWYSQDYATHIGKSPNPGGAFTCMLCLKVFDSLHALTQHGRYSHSDTSKHKHMCTVCNRAFVSASKRNTHMLSHTGQKPHRCQYCAKSFTDQSNLRMHLLIHTGVRRFLCTVCKRAFRQKAHLTSHMLTHTGEKTMECDTCGKMFARRSDLKQHQLQHTKHCIYKCTHAGCNKSFYKMQNLRKHLKIHDGVRAHICPRCQKSFVTAYHLKRHLSSVQSCQLQDSQSATT